MSQRHKNQCANIKPTPNSPVAVLIAIKIEARLAGRVVTAAVAGVATDVGEAALHLGTFLHAVDGFADVAGKSKGGQIDEAAPIVLVTGTYLAFVAVEEGSAWCLGARVRRSKDAQKVSLRKSILERKDFSSTCCAKSSITTQSAQTTEATHRQHRTWMPSASTVHR